jgi:hypothetical protein
MSDETYSSNIRKSGGGFAWSLVFLLGAFGVGLIGSQWFETQVRSRLPAVLGGGTVAPPCPPMLMRALLRWKQAAQWKAQAQRLWPPTLARWATA